jgi:hypothetical protein
MSEDKKKHQKQQRHQSILVDLRPQITLNQGGCNAHMELDVDTVTKYLVVGKNRYGPISKTRIEKNDMFLTLSANNDCLIVPAHLSLYKR